MTTGKVHWELPDIIHLWKSYKAGTEGKVQIIRNFMIQTRWRFNPIDWRDFLSREMTMRLSSNLHIRNKYKVKNDPLTSMFCNLGVWQLKKRKREHNGNLRVGTLWFQHWTLGFERFEECLVGRWYMGLVPGRSESWNYSAVIGHSVVKWQKQSSWEWSEQKEAELSGQLGA